jgi:hypothetical protein
MLRPQVKGVTPQPRPVRVGEQNKRNVLFGLCASYPSSEEGTKLRYPTGHPLTDPPGGQKVESGGVLP